MCPTAGLKVTSNSRIIEVLIREKGESRSILEGRAYPSRRIIPAMIASDGVPLVAICDCRST